MWSILWKNPRHKERITWFYLTSWIFLYFMNSVCIQWIPTIPRMPFSALDSNKSSCGVALNEVNPCNWKMDWWSRTGMLMKLMERGAFFVHVSADWLAKLPNEHYLKISWRTSKQNFKPCSTLSAITSHLPGLSCWSSNLPVITYWWPTRGDVSVELPREEELHFFAPRQTFASFSPQTMQLPLQTTSRR